MAEKPLQSLTIQGLNDIYVNTPLSTAPTFDTTQSYAVDDCVFYNKKLYKFTSAHPAGAWNSTHVTEITVGGELSTIYQDISDLSNTVDGKYEKPANGIPASDLAQGVIPDVSGKADKVNGATNGNFASLDANGNLTDSGHKHSDYLTEAPVTDVQVNGTSVLDAQGVAEIPLAKMDGKPGLVKIYWNGLGITPEGYLSINNAVQSEIKNGIVAKPAIAPNMQHMSTFYGLAKAAGDTTQSQSSNAVGTYTDEAKQAIRQMLGLPKNIYAELIANVTTTEDLEELIINTDINGDPFELRKARVLLFTKPSTTGQNSYLSSSFLNSPSNGYLNFGTGQLQANSNRVFYYDYEGLGAYPEICFNYSSGTGNSGLYGGDIAYAVQSYAMKAVRFYRYNASSTLIPSGSQVIIYGIRL